MKHLYRGTRWWVAGSLWALLFVLTLVWRPLYPTESIWGWVLWMVTIFGLWLWVDKGPRRPVTLEQKLREALRDRMAADERIREIVRNDPDLQRAFDDLERRWDAVNFVTRTSPPSEN